MGANSKEMNLIPLAVIRRYVRGIAEKFRPERIVLFGSYAHGRPTVDSDVDLLVVMPTRDQSEQAIEIRMECPAPFPLDLIVRTPRIVSRSLHEGDPFIREIMSRGIILHEKSDAGVDSKERRRLRGGGPSVRNQASVARSRLLPLPARRPKKVSKFS